MYAKASIFGPYHDINPDNFTNPAPTTRKIEWRVEGTAPTRRFIASYNDVGYFSCGNAIKATHQMVLYENTGVIEVYIKDKPVCSTWNGGKAILGVQDETRTKSVSATGKNATQWGTTGMNEAYRFTPWGASPRFKKAELLVNGTVVALGDTASGNPGELNLNFPNVCPTTDSTAYILRVTYGSCADATLDVSYQDTVFVKRTTPTVSLVTADATCAAGGSILVNTTGGTGFQYSINGAASQPGNSFTNLHSGNYTVIVQSGTCSATAQASIALVNDLTVSALPTDTSMCSGAAFVPRITSSSSAATYSWTPTSGVNGSNQMQPNITTSSQNTQYIVTASRGECQARDSINVTVFQGATADAGPDATIIAGDQVQLQGSAPTGTYLWSPSTGLSATNILNPFASPDQTTTYTLTVTTTQGCTATDNAVVTVVPYCVKPMEAFTPNGDGINDKWLVTNGNCTTAAKTEVFNRYGHKVFESNNYKNDWDGTYKGSPLPDGTYYFVISYQLINGKTVYQKGNVTILR
jgi:gliding motility-associated-like protein